MTQRSIEVVVGRLVTDEAFREAYLRNPPQMLTNLVERGLHLSYAEITALIATDPALWRVVAGQIDSRLRNRSLAQ
jgi:hypothetical protein